MSNYLTYFWLSSSPLLIKKLQKKCSPKKMREAKINVTWREGSGKKRSARLKSATRSVTHSHNFLGAATFCLFNPHEVWFPLLDAKYWTERKVGDIKIVSQVFNHHQLMILSSTFSLSDVQPLTGQLCFVIDMYIYSSSSPLWAVLYSTSFLLLLLILVPSVNEKSWMEISFWISSSSSQSCLSKDEDGDKRESKRGMIRESLDDICNQWETAKSETNNVPFGISHLFSLSPFPSPHFNVSLSHQLPERTQRLRREERSPWSWLMRGVRIGTLFQRRRETKIVNQKRRRKWRWRESGWESFRDLERVSLIHSLHSMSRSSNVCREKEQWS